MAGTDAPTASWTYGFNFLDQTRRPPCRLPVCDQTRMLRPWPAMAGPGWPWSRMAGRGQPCRHMHALFKHCLVQALPCAGVALCRHVQALPCAGVALCRHMHALYIYIYTLPGQGMCVNQVSLEQSAHAGPWPRPRGLNIHRPVDVSTDEVMCQRMKMTRFVSVLVVSNLLMRQMSHTNEHDRI